MPTSQRSIIDLPCIADAGSFARYDPFGNGRQVIVRRGASMGFPYGMQSSERLVRIGDLDVRLTRYTALLSPPPWTPGSTPMTAEAARNYKPESEVLHLPDAEVLIRRAPNGFSDDEVELILAAITLE